jgi:hypothetical protein
MWMGIFISTLMSNENWKAAFWKWPHIYWYLKYVENMGKKRNWECSTHNNIRVCLEEICDSGVMLYISWPRSSKMWLLSRAPLTLFLWNWVHITSTFSLSRNHFDISTHQHLGLCNDQLSSGYSKKTLYEIQSYMPRPSLPPFLNKF